MTFGRMIAGKIKKVSIIGTDMRRKGFTLIEILVVISIITFLSGMVIIGAGRLKEKARIESAKGLISKITLAINEYHLAYFAYPPSEGEYAGSQNLYYFLGQPLEILQGYDPATGEMMKQTFGPAVTGGFKKDEVNSQKYIIDAWETALTYKNPGEDHSNNNGKNNTSFIDIKSGGPNKKFDEDKDPKNDDINNWEIQKYLTK